MLVRRAVSSVVSLKQCVRSVAVSSTIENKREENIKSWREIPGPSSLPVIGQLHHFIPGGALYNMGPELGGVLYKMFGPIVRFDGILGSKPMIFVLDAETSAFVLRSENFLPVRRIFHFLEYFREHVLDKSKSVYSTGLLTDQGEPWKKFRSTVNPILLHSKIIKFYTPSLEEIAEDMIVRLKSKLNKNNILECKFDDEMHLWSFESIGFVALGTRLHCFDPNLPDDAPSKRLIWVVRNLMDVFLELDFRPSPWRYISTPTYRRAVKLLYEQIELNTYFINRAMKQFKEKIEAGDGEKSVLEKLMDIDQNVAVTMASDLLFAGIDTAANTVTSALYLLAKNQGKQNKLREEIRSGDEKRVYLKACIKETLRIMPVVQGNMRHTTKEYNLLGYKIPQDINIVIGHQFLCESEQHYLQPSEFIPERWIVDKTDPLHHGHAHPFAYSPFGFGVRSCIGRRIAELEMEIFLTKLIKNFEVGWFGAPPKIKPSTVNHIAGPYNFTFKELQQDE